MPGYKGHLAGGLITGGILLYAVQELNPTPLTALEWLSFALAGSLFPDIDIKSKGQKLFYPILLGILVLLFYNGHIELVALLAVLGLVPMMVRHRGVFHRLWFVIIFPLFVASVGALLMPECMRIFFLDTLFFIAGAISHLWLDFGTMRMLRGK